jgi:hypothetical protein
MEAFKAMMCRLRGHHWLLFSDGLKRRCTRCEREEWVMSNPHPLIGQPKYYWEQMPYSTPWPEVHASASPSRIAEKATAR